MCFRWHEFCKNNLESNILPLKLHWKTVMTAEMDSSYQKTYKKIITQGSSVNRSWATVVHITGGGHFELCAYRPLGGYPILFAVFFENSIPMCNTMQNYKKVVTKCPIFLNSPQATRHNFGTRFLAIIRVHCVVGLVAVVASVVVDVVGFCSSWSVCLGSSWLSVCGWSLLWGDFASSVRPETVRHVNVIVHEE